MVKKCVRIYIEGGAQGKVANGDFRRAWQKFLMPLQVLARDKNYQALKVVRGKGRSNTFDSFCHHQRQYPDDLCVLLVDAETLVPDNARVWDVVAKRPGDKWQRPSWATERHLYLIVPFVETWLLTDQEALATFFKRGFNPKPLPTNDFENRSKDDVIHALEQATKDCTKGSYRHGQANEIIEFVRPEKVKKLKHGARLFDVLSSLISDTSDGKPD